MADSAQRKEVFVIKEYEKNGERKTYWSKIGSAFVNRDGSLSVILDSLPIDGKMQIRDPQERDSRGGDRNGGGQHRGGREDGAPF